MAKSQNKYKNSDHFKDFKNILKNHLLKQTTKNYTQKNKSYLNIFQVIQQKKKIRSTILQTAIQYILQIKKQFERKIKNIQQVV